MKFSDFGLDSRLVQALTTIQVDEPTPVQETAIPLALNDRKDIIASARTGSGKTLAYLLPLIQSLLHSSGYGIIIVPSRELAEQVSRVCADITKFVSKQIVYVNIAPQLSSEVRKAILNQPFNLVIATPSAALEQAAQLSDKKLEYIVFDEADLLASYGYSDELKELRKQFQSCKPQTWLMGATLGTDIQQLKDLWCTNPKSLTLEESGGSNLKQFFVECAELDKFLLTYVIFKLGLIRGKTLLFTNEIDRAYRLQLFLEQFGIKSVVLNSELPLESRVHIVQQFDKNFFNLLIATDESHLTKNSEYGVSRGVDFKNVACVLNFDLPVSSKAYTHRVGRTARANAKGMSLSFVVPQKEFGKHKIACCAINKNDMKVLERILRKNEVLPYKFDMEQINRFRYRMEDAFRSVTKSKVREARVAEIKQEILASEQLQRHFAENPDDLAALKHDEGLKVRMNRELKNVPQYLLPSSARAPQVLVDSKVRKFNPKVKKMRGKKRGKKRRDPLKLGK